MCFSVFPDLHFFDYFDVTFGLQFAEVVFFFFFFFKFNIRKDTYCVFSEPVDPSEVSSVLEGDKKC